MVVRWSGVEETREGGGDDSAHNKLEGWKVEVLL